MPDLAAGLISPKRRYGERPEVDITVGVVAAGGVAGDGHRREMLGAAAVAAVLSRRPGLRAGRWPSPDVSVRASTSRCRRLRAQARRAGSSASGNGFGGSPRLSTRFQNGVNTRSPRPSLLRSCAGAYQNVATKSFSKPVLGVLDLPGDVAGHPRMPGRCRFRSSTLLLAPASRGDIGHDPGRGAFARAPVAVRARRGFGRGCATPRRHQRRGAAERPGQ